MALYALLSQPNVILANAGPNIDKMLYRRHKTLHVLPNALLVRIVNKLKISGIRSDFKLSHPRVANPTFVGGGIKKYEFERCPQRIVVAPTQILQKIIPVFAVFVDAPNGWIINLHDQSVGGGTTKLLILWPKNLTKLTWSNLPCKFFSLQLLIVQNSLCFIKPNQKTIRGSVRLLNTHRFNMILAITLNLL
jgi:hypothetical protein